MDPLPFLWGKTKNLLVEISWLILLPLDYNSEKEKENPEFVKYMIVLHFQNQKPFLLLLNKAL